MPAGFQNACHSILVFCGESCIEVAVGQMLLCKGETLPEGLCSGLALLAWSGGVGVVSASHPFPLHVLYVVPMATLLCHLPLKS